MCRSCIRVGAATASVLRVRKLRIEPSINSEIIHQRSPRTRAGRLFFPEGCCRIAGCKFKMDARISASEPGAVATGSPANLSHDPVATALGSDTLTNDDLWATHNLVQ